MRNCDRGYLASKFYSICCLSPYQKSLLVSGFESFQQCLECVSALRMSAVITVNIPLQSVALGPHISLVNRCTQIMTIPLSWVKYLGFRGLK